MLRRSVCSSARPSIFKNTYCHETLHHREWRRWTSECCSQSGSAVRRKSQHEISYFKHFTNLLLPLAATSFGSSAAWPCRHRTVGIGICSVQTWLLQCRASWIARCHTGTSSAGFECIGAIDFLPETSGSHHVSTSRTTLASDQTKDRVQTVFSGLLVNQWPGSIISATEADVCFWASRASILAFCSNQDLVIPRTKLKMGERAFDVAAPTAWNNLPDDIKCSSSITIFKKKLKNIPLSVGLL